MSYTLFKPNTGGDPRSFMYYKGEYYIDGSEITLKDEYIKNHTFNGLKLWKHARFSHKAIYNNQMAYFFNRSKYSLCDLLEMGYRDNKEMAACRRDYAPYFVVTALELENAIESFTYPIKLSQEEQDAINKAIDDMIENPKQDWDYPQMIVLWLVYIITMIGSLIFNEFYIVWVLASLIFFKLRKEIVGQ